MGPLQPPDGQLLADAPLAGQCAGLERALRADPVALAILNRGRRLALPSWYLGAGAVAQTVWNQLHGFEAGHGIKDYDLVYFASDLTAEAEQDVERRANELFADLDVQIDVTNEARVHVWYESRFGRSIEPYRSTEHAISTWPTTASSVGVRLDQTEFVVCAPFGLRDLFAMVVRPNPTLVPREVYEEKARRWQARWPRLTVLPW